MNKLRAIFIIFIMIVFASVLIIQLFNIQVREHDDWIYYAEQQQIQTKTIRAERGLILDCNGELLAFDRNDVSFFVDLKMFRNEKQKFPKKFSKNFTTVVDLFSKVLNKSKQHFEQILERDTSSVCLALKIPREKAVQLYDLAVDWLKMREDPTRIYPYDNLASHILGYTGTDKFEGVDGIEKACDDILTGANGKMIAERDVKGRTLTILEDATIPPIHGKSVVLTIDKKFQKILEEELKKGLEAYKSVSAVGIIMNPQNGEVLALANEPDFNPNLYWETDDLIRSNRALVNPYEPGSTFKCISLSTLLDKNLCDANDKVFAENGVYKYKSMKITDSHRHGTLTVRQVIEQSSNIGMAKLIPRINEFDFYKYLRDFGFGNYTGIELPAESRGKLRRPGTRYFDEYTFRTMSYGYGILTTPLQIATAYCALVNGGSLFQPQIVKEIRSRDGNDKEEIKPKFLRQVISREASDKIKDFMVGVVENGTGKFAKSNIVKYAGKTGTSEILENKKYTNRNTASFVGFFPIDNPKIVCLIVYESPQVGRMGGTVAAPIFRSVAEKLVEIDPSLLISTKSKEKQARFEEVLASDNKESGLTSYMNNTDGDSEKKSPVVKNKKIMPDLVSYDLRDAISILNQIGLRYKVNGNGKVISQSIQPGFRLQPNSVCSLNCGGKKLSGIRLN